ncbi:MAG: PhzF family phenazine biosynthesis protein, partial [Cohaesibacteraceae bacterium]|nr:PhzF family phenazine biosynthesis protein [Cohaesibacteraceae bacterium]
SNDLRSKFAAAFNLGMEDLADDLPLEVISTGLEYLVLPVRSGLSNAHITILDLELQLEAIGAQFCYLLDVDRFEGRHWNNDGVMEDVATGSAAGVVGAYARRHGLVRNGKTFILKQGHFMGRPSELHVTAYGDCNNVERITVAGAVSIVGTGTLDVLPEIGT